MKARIGNIKKVENQKKKNAENAIYYSVILKNENGYLNFIFTESQIKEARDRALKNPEDVLERSFFSYLLD